MQNSKNNYNNNGGGRNKRNIQRPPRRTGKNQRPVSKAINTPIPRNNANVNSRKIASAPKKKGFVNFVASKFSKNKETIELIRYGEGVDRIFLIVVVILLSFGTVMVFSASYANALWRYGDAYHFAKRQFMMAIIGVVAMIITSYLAEYNFLRKISVLFFVGVLGLNYITPFFGILLNSTPRWFVLFGIQFQPSELLKIAIVLMFAYYITKLGDKMKTLRWGIVVPMMLIGAIGLAMLLQSHFSGLIILAALGILMIFIGEAPIVGLGACAGIGAAGLFYIIKFTPYANARINTWLDPFNEAFRTDEAHQIIQSLYAIGSGGVLGVGIGQSKQKYLYLPEPQNDFIFSIICEEVGFIGAVIIIFLFVILIWRGFVIAYHAPDKFSSLVVMGITLKVAIQFILNIAVVTNSVPTTGISLPFFSYGGTALIILLVEMGIILSISRYSYQEKA